MNRFENLIERKSVLGQSIYSYCNNRNSKNFLYLIAGVHGDEVEGIFVLEKFFDWIKQSNPSIPIIVVPTLNVDGYQKQTRLNANGVDLNRNLPTFDWTNECTDITKYNPGPSPLSEPENQFLIELFNHYPPNLVFSFHSWQPMINYNGDCKKIADYISSINDYPSVASVGYDTPGSLGSYLPEKFNVPVITYELPTIAQKNPDNSQLALEQIWQENSVALEKTFKYLIQN